MASSSMEALSVCCEKKKKEKEKGKGKGKGKGKSTIQPRIQMDP